MSAGGLTFAKQAVTRCLYIHVGLLLVVWSGRRCEGQSSQSMLGIADRMESRKHADGTIDPIRMAQGERRMSSGIKIKDGIFGTDAENYAQRVPCVVVMDCSYSMDGRPIESLNEGLKKFE
jgi:hypothetical protein